MYLQKKDKESNLGYKKMAVLALLGVTACFGATLIPGSTSQEVQSAEKLQTLESNFADVPVQEDLIEMSGSLPTFKQTKIVLEASVKALDDNVQWVYKIIDDLAHNEILKQLSKDHNRLLGFDISNVIKDTELIAEATQQNLSRLQRKAALRKRLVKDGKLTEKHDMMVLKSWVDGFASDLEYQVGKIKEVLSTLEKLQKGSFKIRDDAVNDIHAETKKIQQLTSSGKSHLNSLESKLSALKCDFFEAQASFTHNCMNSEKIRQQIGHEQNKIRHSAKKHRENIHSFMAEKATAVELASVFDTKSHRDISKLQHSIVGLAASYKAHYKDAGFDYTMGSDLAARDKFAATFEHDLDGLDKSMSTKVSTLKTLKARLDKILIWG